MLKISQDELRALKPCNVDERIKLFGRRKPLNVAQAFKAGVSIRDVLWVLGRSGRKDLCVRFALESAQRVAHHSSDPRTQKALDATKAWLDNPTEVNRKAAADAAYAAA